MYLLFDLSEKNVIRLALFDEQKRKDFFVAGRNRDLLGVVDDVLNKEGLTKEAVQGVATVVGAGGFTSTRIAAVVANVFAYAQKIPVVAVAKEGAADSASLASLLSEQRPGAYVSAAYSGVPNIIGATAL